MPARILSIFLLLSSLATSVHGEDSTVADLTGFRDVIAPLLKTYCLDCHGADVQDGKLSLHDIDPDVLTGEQMETWRIVYEQLRFGDMPPEDEPQPSYKELAAMVAWIRGELLKTQRPGVVSDQKLLSPAFGNYVDHDALFNEPASPVIPAAPRVWRMRPEIYDAFTRSITEGVRGQSQPFTVAPGEGIKDFAAIYYIDEPSTDLLLRNAQLIVDNQTGPKGKWRDLKTLVDEQSPPTDEQVQRAIHSEFTLALRRAPTDEELKRFAALYEKTTKAGGHVIGGKAMLMAIVMQPEAVFRLELGQGPVDNLGRRRLSQGEIAVAVSYALGNRPDNETMRAAEEGKLATREQIADQVRAMLASPKTDTSRIMQFFREYFGYPEAVDVFKDPPPAGKHEPGVLVSDLEYLIQDILDSDRDVLYELLTTNRAYVNYSVDKKRGTVSPKYNKREYETVYGLPPDWKWTAKQPIKLPADERAGVLTHPAWLTAFSGNFDNHPVQRGKWVRTHLLGGSVPDVPIGVDARIPDDMHRTLRDRLAGATSKAECWRCHRKMDPLGLPFEKFTHYGHARRYELDEPVDTSGAITRTGDTAIDGEIEDPIPMLHKLARSEHVEQVFIRHAFRYFLGRNETLGDAKTLQDAHAAYKKSDGSFNAIVVSLLSSDSFNYRGADRLAAPPKEREESP